MMQKVKSCMQEMIGSLNDKQTTDFFNSLPFGKMLRTKLILCIAPNSDKSVKLASIVELIHLASLLHDDVIDSSLQRRGSASFNAKFGDKNAIMLGDILYSYAFHELSSFDPFIAKSLSKAVSMLSIGEMQDVHLSANFNTDRQKYMDMIYAKTAILIESLAVSAAFLANKDTEKFAIYGKNLGLAFQIIDDLLDITQDSKTLGKPALHDFKEGKTTLPYMYVYEKLNAEDKERLRGMFKKDLNKSDTLWVKQMMSETGAIERSYSEAKELGIDALQAIEDENNQKLNEVVTSMIEREF